MQNIEDRKRNDFLDMQKRICNQRREIERLHKVIEAKDAAITELKAAPGKAVTEFAERIKKYYSCLSGKTLTATVIYFIDQVAKEMRGD